MEEFREACGPADPEVARALYPETIRALLGVQQVEYALPSGVGPSGQWITVKYYRKIYVRSLASKWFRTV